MMAAINANEKRKNEKRYTIPAAETFKILTGAFWCLEADTSYIHPCLQLDVHAQQEVSAIDTTSGQSNFTRSHRRRTWRLKCIRQATRVCTPT